MAARVHDALRMSITTTGTDHRDLYTHHSYCHAEHARRRAYAAWFWSQPGDASNATRLADSNMRRTLVRFRLGAHGLQVVTAVRSKAGHVKRADRLCRCCSMQVVEDEFHVVFECPLYNEVRLRFSELFRTWCVQLSVDYVTLQISDNAGRMMQQFFAHAKQATVARFISLCLTKRQQQLSPA